MSKRQPFDTVVNQPQPVVNKIQRRRLALPRWAKVQRARELIQERSDDIAKALIKQAVKGDAETGRWLLSHIAATDPDGKEIRPIASAIDKQIEAPGGGTQVLIGVSLGADFARLSQSVSPAPVVRELPSNLPTVPVLDGHTDSEPAAE